MHQSIKDFAKKNKGYITGRVLEVGSQDVNGTIRDELPISLGVDMSSGKGVDLVIDSKDLIHYFGLESFDSVVSCDMLEHAEDWKAAMINMWGVLKSNGYLLITMANPKKGYHGYPSDYWRFPMDRFKKLFGENHIHAEFFHGPSMGVVVQKSHPLDLTVEPDKVERK